MNKFFILIALSLFAFKAADAQTEKGTQSLGLNFGFSYSSGNDFIIYPSNGSTSTLSTNVTTFNIGPNYSYFIADNLDIGAALSFSSSSTNNNSGNFATNNDGYALKQFSDNYGGSVYIRKYVMYKNKIGFRTGGYLGFSGGTGKNTYAPANVAYNYNNKTNYYSAGANLDLVYFPSKNIGISATLANLEYYHYTADNTTQGHDSGDGIGFSLVNNGLSLSIFYVFGK